jgi:hypothetical protein
VIPLVVAIERGRAQTNVVSATLGLQDYNMDYRFEVEFSGKLNHRE